MSGKEWRGCLRQPGFIRSLEAEGIMGWCSPLFLFVQSGAPALA